ncbi:MAG: sugar-non-specific nuclease NucA [Aeromicrobium sp.]|nr:sugar-non-specific nuclease NucA [Aeromicrobium sp.]
MAVAGCGTPVPASAQVPISLVTRVGPTSIHLALGEPRDLEPSDDVIVDHGVFVISYNPTKLVPNWVAWRLVAEDLGTAERSNHFHSDPMLAVTMPSPRPRDYTRSGYDRGHLCPSGDRTGSADANEETFVMTNMEPQRHALNVGPWKGLEDFERQLARADKQVFLVAGGLFDAASPTLAGGEVVPRANFKIIVVLDRGAGAGAVNESTTTYAVIMPNSTTVSGTRWPDYLVSIDEVESQSGYDFLSSVPEDIQRRLEARTGHSE